MAQRKSPSYPEWPVDRSVYSLFCGWDHAACRREHFLLADRDSVSMSVAINFVLSLR